MGGQFGAEDGPVDDVGEVDGHLLRLIYQHKEFEGT